MRYAPLAAVLLIAACDNKPSGPTTRTVVRVRYSPSICFWSGPAWVASPVASRSYAAGNALSSKLPAVSVPAWMSAR